MINKRAAHCRLCDAMQSGVDWRGAARHGTARNAIKFQRKHIINSPLIQLKRDTLNGVRFVYLALELSRKLCARVSRKWIWVLEYRRASDFDFTTK